MGKITKGQKKQDENRVKRFVREHSTGFKIVAVGIGVLGATYVGVKCVPKLKLDNTKNILPQGGAENMVEKTLETVKESVEVIKNIEKPSPRYLVEFKAFKTGDWYPKTRTDYVRSAYSVGACNSYGRAYRIIDTVTGDTLKEVAEDASMAACNGYPNGYPW